LARPRALRESKFAAVLRQITPLAANFVALRTAMRAMKRKPEIFDLLAVEFSSVFLTSMQRAQPRSCLQHEGKQS
jgi:hypothetical protein